MDKDFLKKIKDLKKDDTFLISITTLNKDGKPGEDLDTFIFANNFLYEDMAGTKKMIGKLIDGLIKDRK